jgi:hypothetical protein
MAEPARPLTAITHDAISTLFREIGIADTVRFLHQFTLGSGDYTRERQELFGDLTLEEIGEAIRKRKSEGS